MERWSARKQERAEYAVGATHRGDKVLRELGAVDGVGERPDCECKDGEGGGEYRVAEFFRLRAEWKGKEANRTKYKVLTRGGNR